MAAKVLNLDALAKEERVITFGGNTYPMKEMSVKDFIEITRRAEKIDKDAKKNDSLADRVEFLAETAMISFPTCPKGEFLKKSLSELNAIVAFARDGSIPEGAEQDDVEDGAEDAGEEKNEQETKESQS